MQNKSDAQLLGDYAAQGSDPAFAEIVARHTDLVYSVACRQTGSPELAHEVAQMVFTDLARKARALPREVLLTGWLYQAARFAAAKAVRGEQRRQAREQEALTMQHLVSNPGTESAPGWEQLAPVLDDAMGELTAPDRDAILLRYFKNQDFHAVALALGVSDAAAQRRVSRAVERLREFLVKRGVTAGASGLVVLISANAVLTAPAGLSAAIAASAMAAGTGVAFGLWAQLASLAGRFSVSAVALTVLVLGTIALVALREVQTPNAPPAPSSFAPPASATNAPVQRNAREASTAAARPNASVTDASQRDWALKLYREGEDFQRNKQLDDAWARFNMAAAIIESGLPPERWMVDFYFTRATFDLSSTVNAKRETAAVIEDYTKALRIDPNFSSALANRALAYSALKQYDAANADFIRLIEDPTVDYSHYGPGPTNGIAHAHEYRGRMWLDARRPLEAIPDLQNAVTLYDKPDERLTAQFYLAAAYKSSQQTERLVAEANSMAEQALKWATQRGGTSEEEGAAKSGARWAAEFMDYKASYQLEVIAAVKAKERNFSEAVDYQEKALRYLPASAENQRETMQARLELYRNGKSLVTP